MNILHITDFHYTNESAAQIKVVKSIVKSILKSGAIIDFVFFTGDIVQAGNKIETFQSASKALFEELSNKLNVKKENIIFCAGNHDIDRSKVHSAANAYFESSITSDEKLNNFYNSKKDSMYLDSLKPSDNYRTFLESFHPTNELNINKDLYSIHFRSANNEKIGIVCLNSAWISAIDKNGKEDKGNLLIPQVLLEEVKNDLREVDKKIILIHHPLYFLKDFNFYGIENFIHNEFDLMFSGHVHKISSVSRHSGTNGIFEHVAKASLSSKEALGCSLIEIDEIEENKIHVKELTCINDDEECYIGQKITHTIPCGIEKSKLIAFRRKIFDKISLEKESANNLLLIKEDEEIKDFLLLYNHPILKKESEGGLESKKTASISMEELLNGFNYLILGKDKCGKTSLLKRIQIDCLINYSKQGKIPYFFDAREFELRLDSNFNMEQYIKSYFGINKEKAQEILSTNNFLLLVDNYSPNSGMAAYLDEFVVKYPNISYIICAEYNLSRTVDVIQFGESVYDKLFFHDLRRKEIVAYTEKRLSSKQKKEEVHDKIIQLCKQLELPLNYWTVSLLLLIHNKSSDSYFKNLFSVLDVCVDEIFGKKQLLIMRSRISFEQLKTICAELAKHLFVNHEQTVYSASSEEIVVFIDNIIIENDRISTNGKDVFNYFVSCGILKQKEDDSFVFRLNGFFEYFLAFQMTKDPTFKKQIIDDEEKYLAFKNQLEIYSGFKRDDIEFLTTIYNKSRKKIDPIFGKYNKNKDNELLMKIKEPQNIEDTCRKLSIQKSLTAIQKAEIEDVTDELTINSDVHLIEGINPEIINSELLERYLVILSRVFRNSDEILGNKDKKTEIFNAIIDYYCDFGFFLIDEFSEFTKKEIEKDDFIDIENFPELNLLRFISNFSPIIAQTSLFDGLGHFNLERMIKNEIDKLEANPSENQYKLFILYFLLLDIDINTNREYIDIALDKIKMPILKYIAVIKLNYYLAFKTSNNKVLQRFLSNKIQQAKLSLDNKTDIGEIQKQIQEKKRISNTNNNQL